MQNKNLIKNTLKTKVIHSSRFSLDPKGVNDVYVKQANKGVLYTFKAKLVSTNTEKTSKKVKVLETVRKKTHSISWNYIINKVTPIPKGFASPSGIGEVNTSTVTLTGNQVASPQGKPVCSEFIDPHNYANIFGYRHNKAILNPNLTFQGIRRVLHYLKKVVSTNSLNSNSLVVPELILVLDPNLNSSTNTSMYSEPFSQRSALQESIKQKKNIGRAIDLFAYSILRLQKTLFTNSDLKITLKTTKDAISYLSTYSGIASINGTLVEGKQELAKDNKIKPCGVIIINPAKSALCTLADRIFGRVSKKGGTGLSTSNALGYLCAKKGIPLISLCDITSTNIQQNKAIYPIFCDTRDINSFYLIFDVLSYGLNKNY